RLRPGARGDGGDRARLRCRHRADRRLGQRRRKGARARRGSGGMRPIMTRLARIPALALLAFLCAAPSLAQEVPTPKVDVTDSYHGVTVRDPYRWLEDAADPKVMAWTAAQNARTRASLDAVPSRAAIKAKLNTLIT